MTGDYDSVIGMDKEEPLRRFTRKTPGRVRARQEKRPVRRRGRDRRRRAIAKNRSGASGRRLSQAWPEFWVGREQCRPTRCRACCFRPHRSIRPSFQNVWNAVHLAENGARRAVDRFDAEFYGHFHRDLRGVTNRMSLLRHYAEHGAAEGRVINLKQAQLNASKKFPPLPGDFDLSNYMNLNKDLRGFLIFDWEYLLHYVEFGRGEGRIYKIPEPVSIPAGAPRATIYALRNDGVGTRLLTILHAKFWRRN